MPELDWLFGYPAAILLMIVADWLLYRNFKRVGWL
jgi:magnesium transporter